MSLRYKIGAVVLILLFTFQSLNQINNHTYSAGLRDFHKDQTFSCFAANNYSHSIYNCGQTFHLP
jgi:hypothetical protein